MKIPRVHIFNKSVFTLLRSKIRFKNVRGTEPSISLHIAGNNEDMNMHDVTRRDASSTRFLWRRVDHGRRTLWPLFKARANIKFAKACSVVTSIGNEARHKIHGFSEMPHKFRLNSGVLKRRVFKRLCKHANSRIYLRGEIDVIYTSHEASFLLFRIKH